jgi:hypothetical protein
MDSKRILEVDAVGHDSNGEPVARGWQPPDEDALVRGRIWVIPITDAAYIDLSERLTRSDTGLVEFEIDQALLDLTADMQKLRSTT